MGRLPCRYPILSTLTPGRAEGLCAERHSTVNTLRVLRLSGGLLSYINLRVEPRASSSGTAHHGDSVPGSTPLTVVYRVYPGMYSREVYREAYTTLGYQGGYTGIYHTRYPGGYTRYIPP